MNDIIEGRVSGYSLYKVDHLGNVWSRARGDWAILKGSTSDRDYIKVILKNDDGEAIRWMAHRFIATALIQNPDDKPEVNHKDGDKKNNRRENLEWVTRSENLEHRYRVLGQHGAFYGKYGAEHRDSVAVIQFGMDGSFINIHMGMAEAKRNTGANNIHQCCNGVQRSSGGFVWTYADHNNLQRVIDGLDDDELSDYDDEILSFRNIRPMDVHKATPLQKCEAILKALGKWTVEME